MENRFSEHSSLDFFFSTSTDFKYYLRFLANRKFFCLRNDFQILAYIASMSLSSELDPATWTTLEGASFSPALLHPSARLLHHLNVPVKRAPPPSLQPLQPVRSKLWACGGLTTNNSSDRNAFSRLCIAFFFSINIDFILNLIVHPIQALENEISCSWHACCYTFWLFIICKEQLIIFEQRFLFAWAM